MKRYILNETLLWQYTSSCLVSFHTLRRPHIIISTLTSVSVFVAFNYTKLELTARPNHFSVAISGMATKICPRLHQNELDSQSKIDFGHQGQNLLCSSAIYTCLVCILTTTWANRLFLVMRGATRALTTRGRSSSSTICQSNRLYSNSFFRL